MSSPPTAAVVDAVRHLLLTIPDRWAVFDPDQLTHPEFQVLTRLHAFGQIERRAAFVCTSPAAAGVVRGACVGSGLPPIPFEGGNNLLAAWAAAWGDAQREWASRHPATLFPIVTRGERWEWRVTADGLVARQHAAENPEVVCGYLFGRGVLVAPGVNGYVRIVDVTIDCPTHTPPPPAPATVNVGNWPEGATALAAALMQLMAQQQPRPGPTGADGTGRRGNKPLEEENPAKLVVYQLIHRANAAFEQGGGSRKGRPRRFLTHLETAAEHKQLRESIAEAGLTLSLDIIKNAVDAINKRNR